MRNYIRFSFSTILVSIVNIISIFIFTRIFSPESYAQANLIITISVVYSTLIMLGADQSVIRFFYSIKLKNLIKNSIRSIAISIIVSTVIFSIVLYFVEIEFLTYKIIILIVIYSVLFIQMRLISVIIRMLQNSKLYTIMNVGQKALEIVLVVSMYLIWNESFYFLIFSYLISSIILIVGILTIVKSELFKEDESKNDISMKMQLSYSVPLMISILIATLNQNVDKIILSQFVSFSELGVYYSAFKIIGLVTIVQSIFTLVWVPNSIKVFEQKKGITNYLTNSSRAITLLMISMGIVFIIVKDYVIFFLGPEYKDAASVLPMLILIPIFYIMSETTVSGLTLLKKSKYHIYISIITFSANLILSFILIMYFDVLGAATAVGLSSYILYLVRSYYGLRVMYFDFGFFRIQLLNVLFITWCITNSYTTYLNSNILLIVVVFVLLFIFKTEFKKIVKIANKWMSSKDNIKK